MTKKSSQNSELKLVKASNIFDDSSWSSNRSPLPAEDLNSDMELDENITRLLSESDTSMEKSFNESRQKRVERRERRGLSFLSVPSMEGSPFKSADLGTPLAETGSPTVMMTDEYFSMDISRENSADKSRLTRHWEDASGNTSSESYREDSSNASTFSTLRDETLFSSSKKRCLPYHRPLPDPSGFEDHHHPQQPLLSSPACPPTPLRTPSWQSSDEVDVLHTHPLSHHHPLPLPRALWMTSSTFHCHSPTPAPPLLARQNSLSDTKVLLAQSEDDEEQHQEQDEHMAREVNFYRDFVVEEVIGDGNFAVVYRVHENSTTAAATRTTNTTTMQGESDQDPSSVCFAVKKIKQQFRSRKYREFLMNEVRIMKEVGHAHCPYILRFYQAWQEEGHFYVQLDLARGGSLKDLLVHYLQERVLFSEDSLWHILHDAAAGLRHIHACDIVHLDIKPANLLISRGHVLIGDFGMASRAGSMEDGREGDTRLASVIR
eukprot:scaffold1244_cov162-Ochromonas_danica.AAC.35